MQRVHCTNLQKGRKFAINPTFTGNFRRPFYSCAYFTSTCLNAKKYLQNIPPYSQHLLIFNNDNNINILSLNIYYNEIISHEIYLFNNNIILDNNKKFINNKYNR